MASRDSQKHAAYFGVSEELQVAVYCWDLEEEQEREVDGQVGGCEVLRLLRVFGF